MNFVSVPPPLVLALLQVQLDLCAEDRVVPQLKASGSSPSSQVTGGAGGGVDGQCALPAWPFLTTIVLAARWFLGPYCLSGGITEVAHGVGDGGMETVHDCWLTNDEVPWCRK